MNITRTATEGFLKSTQVVPMLFAGLHSIDRFTYRDYDPSVPLGCFGLPHVSRARCSWRIKLAEPNFHSVTIHTRLRAPYLVGPRVWVLRSSNLLVPHRGTGRYI